VVLATAAVACGTVLLMLLSGSLPAAVSAVAWASPPGSPTSPIALAASLGASELAAAEASLAAGQGPAAGEPVGCSTANGGLSASCASGSTASALTIVSFTVHPTPDSLAYPNTYTTTVTGGSPPYSYSYTGLPYPCTSANVSKFSCEAYYLGEYNITVTVTDTAHSTAAATAKLVVNCTGCLGGLTYGSAINPPARTQAAIAYDVKDGYTVMFGGWNGSALFDDTWFLKTNKWEPLDPVRSPSDRYDASMAYDKKDGYVVLFGGRTNTTVDGDTWTFLNNTWTELSPAASPSPRYGAALSWDAKDNYLLLFGGSNGTSTLSDTWSFVGGNWTQLYPVPPKLPALAPEAGSSGSIPLALPLGAGAPRTPITQPTMPAGRTDAGVTYDYKDGYVLLFGGLNQSGGTSTELSDTWAFESGKWVYLTESKAPSPRSQAVLVYDASLNYTVLFGGANVTTPQQFQDTWTFANGTWKKLALTSAPSPRQGAQAVWDGDDLKLLVFSGDEEGLPANIPDSWFFLAGNWSVDRSTPEFSAPQPSARVSPGLAFDAASGYSIYFGGLTQYGANGETWGYANQEWTQIFPTTSPSPRSFPAMAYDAKDGYVVLFGGRNSTGGALHDTWIFKAIHNASLKVPVVGGNWTELTPTVSPPARYGAGMTYDSADGVILMFGGIGKNGGVLDDTWTFTGGNWTKVTPGGTGGVPSGRAFPVLLNDTKDGYVLLFGGMSGSSALSDTWTYKAGNWTSLLLTEHPSARWGASGVYDPINNQTVLFGGCGQFVNPVLLECDQLLNDTWHFIGGKWSPLSRDPSPFAREGAAIDFDGSPSDIYVLISGGLVNRTGELLTTDRWDYAGQYVQWAEPLYPSARAGAASIYEIRDQHIVMFGGYGPLPTGGYGYLNDTWEWDTYVWNQVANNGAVCKGCANHHPSPRAWGAIAWDPISGQEIYFGGRNQTTVYGQTWAFEGSYTTGQWTELNPTVAPPARTNESMAWDENDNCVVLFGGENSTGAPLGDTWTFVGGQWTEQFPSVSPTHRAGADMEYDSTTHFTLLFGGWNPVSGVAYNDTWKYVGGAWTNITPTSGPNPSPRYGPTMSDDPQDSAVMIFGGETATGAYLGDTWYFRGGTWTQVVTKGNSPLPSAFGCAGNDESDGNVMMFGGYNGNYLGQFWVFF